MTNPRFKLRVLSGRLAGSEVAIEPGVPLRIGSGFDNDVVLLDGDGTRALTLIVPEDGPATIEIHEGGCVLLETEVVAPERALLPPFIPLKAGAFTLAWGGAMSPRWEEALMLASAAPPAIAEDAPPPPAPRAPTPVSWLQSALVSAMRRETVFAGGVLLTALIVAPPMLRSMSAVPPAGPAAEVALAARYPGLNVNSSADGHAIVTGEVPLDADRRQIAALLEQHHIPAEIGVSTGESEARAVAEVFKQGGYPVTTRPVSPGVVAVAAAPMPADIRERLTNLALGDVPGLTKIEIDAPVASPDAPGIPADPAAKRVVEVVGGEDGFVETADGARYFRGGYFPGGERLVAIEGRTVTFETSGRTRQVTF